MSVLLLVLLLRVVPLAELRDALARVRLDVLAAVVLLHGGILVLRVRRWEWVVAQPEPPGRLPSAAAWDAVFIGWFANFALPAKIGELARPWVYADATKRPFAAVLATVAFERVLDLLALGVLFWVAFAVLPGADGLPDWFARFAGIGGLASLGGLLALGALWRWGPRDGVVGRFREGLDLFSRPRSLIRALLLTAAVWAAELIGVVLTLVACGADVAGVARVAAAASQAVVSTLAVAVPAAPGGLGVDQWATILSLRPFGVDDAVATAVSLVDMAAVLAWIIPIGFLAFLRRGGRGLARSIADEA